jgi:7,8-dihydropterin-6-yl-methyl-4-(beta-D-ribofuranosyl)aminobenzene 5'-phosphate synthase
VSVRITLLVDNERGAPGLRAQWGFSAWIDTGEARILLDCGRDDAFWRNARTLGVPLDAADAFVLSHGHFDHGGGLRRVVEAAPAARLVLHPSALAPHFWLCKTAKVNRIGLPDRSLTALRSVAERVTWALGPVEVAPRAWASGPIPRRHPLEEAERNFFLDHACSMRDQVVDDQAMWVETPSGLVVLVGCAHSGIINTLDYVRRVSADSGSAASQKLPLAADGLPRVFAVIGGMHLLHASPARLRATGDALATAGVRLLAPVHCTGKRGKAHLRERLADAWVACATGSVLEID